MEAQIGFRASHRPVARGGRARPLGLQYIIQRACGAALATLCASAFVFAQATAGAGPGTKSEPHLQFTKTFKGGTPEFVGITINLQGKGTFRSGKRGDMPNPRPLALSPSVTRRIFSLAHSLGDFKSIKLESRKPVAYLGEKTFTYQANGGSWTVKFNYTQNRDGQQLDDLFEGLAAVELHIVALDYQARYDPLALPNELSRVGTDLDGGDLTDPALLVPVLQRIAANSEIMDLGRVRARRILKRIEESSAHRRRKPHRH